MTNPSPANTATTDKFSGIIVLIGLFLFMCFAILFPAIWIAGEKWLTHTNIGVFSMYKFIAFNLVDLITQISRMSKFMAIEISLRICAPVIIAASFSWYIARHQIRPKKVEIIEKGVKVIEDPKNFLKEAKTRLATAKGIKIHPEVRLHQRHENLHIFLAGATGAGKTMALQSIIKDILDRKDKAIISDIKFDFTSQLISPDPEQRKRDKRYLVAPWDERSVQWDIAEDITNKLDARSFATAFIVPTGKEGNPYFIKAAQQVLAAVILFLIKTKKRDWSWIDIKLIMDSPPRTLECLEAIKSGAAKHIALDENGTPSPQTQGVIGSIETALESLDVITDYWTKKAGIPLIKNFLDDRAKGVVIVVAARPDNIETSTPLIAGFMSLLLAKALSLPDSDERKMFLLLDELAAFPKLDKLKVATTLGRSKGMRIVAGSQDNNGLEDVYGDKQLKSILSQFGTFILGKQGDKDSAEWCAGLFGTQTTERLQISENKQQQGQGGLLAPLTNVNTTWQKNNAAALIDSDFMHMDKANKDGFVMFVRMADSEGKALLGKLHYELHIVPSIYPHEVKKLTAEEIEDAKIIESSKAKPQSPNGSTMQDQPTIKKQESMVKTEAGDLEELEAILESQKEPEAEQEPEHGVEEDSTMSTQIAGASLEAIGLHGADLLLDVAEALTDGGQQGANGTTQQSVTTKKKRTKKLKSSLAEGL